MPRPPAIRTQRRPRHGAALPSPRTQRSSPWRLSPPLTLAPHSVELVSHRPPHAPQIISRLSLRTHNMAKISVTTKRVMLLLLVAGVEAFTSLPRDSKGKAAYVVTFPDRGSNYPKGIITLVQTAATGDLAITTSLTGLEGAALGNKWHGALPRACVKHALYSHCTRTAQSSEFRVHSSLHTANRPGSHRTRHVRNTRAFLPRLILSAPALSAQCTSSRLATRAASTTCAARV